MRRPLGIPCLACALGLLAANACGGGAKEAQAPAGAAEPEPQTIEEAQARIESARGQISGAPAAATATPAASVETSATGGAAAGAEKSEAGDRVGAECATACRAISSMRHAVDAVCRLAGDKDGRCSDARKTLADSEARVARCSC